MVSELNDEYHDCYFIHDSRTKHCMAVSGLLLVVGIGVALGVALGIILLATILTCFRRKKQQRPSSQHTSDPLLSDTPTTRDSEDRASVATIGRSPRSVHDPLYDDRKSIYSCRTLPHNSAARARDETYCTCVQGANPMTSSTYGRARGRLSSFVTFKPDHTVDVYSARDDDVGDDVANADTRSLDLIRETESSQNIANLQRSSMTPQLPTSRHVYCNKCAIPVTICACQNKLASRLLAPPSDVVTSEGGNKSV